MATVTFGEYVDRYLSQVVDFGGEPMTRGEVLLWFEREGHPRICAELWLLGYDRTHTCEVRR